MVLLVSEYKKLKHGDAAPHFSLPGTDGKTYSLRQFHGARAVLIIFMCNHCPYVLPKIKEIKRLAHDFKDKGVIVIGINPNEDEQYPEDSFEKMKEYYQKWGIPFYYLRDATQDVAKAYGAVCTPDPFLLDSSFHVVYHGRIDDTHGKEQAAVHELHEAIGEFLKSGKIFSKEMPSMGCSIKWKEE